jgi:hypothetical protein
LCFTVDNYVLDFFDDISLGVSLHLISQGSEEMIIILFYGSGQAHGVLVCDVAAGDR